MHFKETRKVEHSEGRSRREENVQQNIHQIIKSEWKCVVKYFLPEIWLLPFSQCGHNIQFVCKQPHKYVRLCRSPDRHRCFLLTWQDLMALRWKLFFHKLVNILPVPSVAMSAMNQPRGKRPLMALWLEAAT